MPQIANQDYIRVSFTGAFSAMDNDTKKVLKAKYDEGVIYDVIVKSSTEGESRILAAAETVSDGVVTKVEITVVDATTGVPEKVTIYQAA